MAVETRGDVKPMMEETRTLWYPGFKPHEDVASVGPRWTDWITGLRNYFSGMNIFDNTRKRALLFHFAGQDVLDIFETLEDTGVTSDFEKAVDALNKHFLPLHNRVYETLRFRELRQVAGESVDAFYARLRKAARYCAFHDANFELMIQLIVGLQFEKLRSSALQDEDISLNSVLKKARRLERVGRQLPHLTRLATGATAGFGASGSNEEATISQIQRPGHSRPGKKSNTASTAGSSKEGRQCWGCGGEWPHPEGRRSCPASGKKCAACGALHHFAKVCRKTQAGTRPVRVVDIQPQSEESSEEGHIFRVGNETTTTQSPIVRVVIGGRAVSCLIDSGAQENIVSRRQLRDIDPNATLTKTALRLKPFGGRGSIPVVGKWHTTVCYKTVEFSTTICVVEEEVEAILGYQDAVELGILKIVRTVGRSSCEPEREFPALFCGIGLIKDFPVSLQTLPEVQPICCTSRRIPFQLRAAVEDEIQRLKEADIIEDAVGPTPWISPIVIVPRPKDPTRIRLCIDLRGPNKAIRRERFVMPTLDDILVTLNGACIFSKLDLREGYHQLLLEPSSRIVTTFCTHSGVFRYKRLNFGINTAAEVFQQVIQRILPKSAGILNVSDDIVVAGVDQKEHDTRLRAVLRALQEAGATLNREKCVFSASSITFFGHVFAKDGVRVDPEKVAAVQRMQAPQSAGELKSFLGMISYCGRFLPNLATRVHPLREALKVVKFEWTDRLQVAFADIKTALAHTQTLAYFDAGLSTILTVDASPIGIAAVLAQEDGQRIRRPIAYFNRKLSAAEGRYSQIERELLAMVLSAEHFRVFLIGGRVTIETDHLPLVSIIRSSSRVLSVRLERLVLRLQAFSFEVRHIPGKDNPADYLSRHVGTDENAVPVMTAHIKRYVRFVSTQSIPWSMSIQTIAQATAADELLKKVMVAVRSGNDREWLDEQLQAFRHVREELSISDDDILLRGTRIIIPQVLQTQVLNLAHSGHQGIVKTKQRLRTKVWFPTLDKQVEGLIRDCAQCQVAAGAPTAVPLMMSELPDFPWQQVAMDFAGPVQQQHYLLVLVDEFSRFPIVEVVRSQSAEIVIGCLERIFGVFGIPERIRSDNGPPFQSAEFGQFCSKWNIRHKTSTPTWPQGNGQVERTIKNVKRVVNSAQALGRSWSAAVRQWMLAYRDTPHSTTGESPFQLFFGRPMRSNLPDLIPRRVEGTVRERDRVQKERMKEAADKRRKAKEVQVSVGAYVLIRAPPSVKGRRGWIGQPWRVVDKRGGELILSRLQQTIRRWIADVKPISDECARQLGAGSDDVDGGEGDSEEEVSESIAGHGAIVEREEGTSEQPEKGRPEQPGQAEQATTQSEDSEARKDQGIGGGSKPERVTRGQKPKRLADFIVY